MIKNIILVDNYELFRTGLSKLLESDNQYKVTRQLCLEELLLEKKEDTQVDLIILDPFVRGYDIKEVFDYLKHNFEDVPLMVFTNTVNKRVILESIEYGVSAYFTKAISSNRLKELVLELTHKTRKSDIRLEEDVKNELSNPHSKYIQFSTAEQDVLRLVCQQKSSLEIAKHLGISARTVESRKRNMMLKTKSKNMIGVLMYGIRSRLVETLLD